MQNCLHLQKIKRSLCFVLLLSISGFSAAVDDGLTESEKFRFEAAFSQDSELIGPILKDSDGFFWFGAVNSALRYDGKEIKGVADTQCSAIAEDSDGSILISSRSSGVIRLSKETGAMTHYTHL